MSTDTTGRKYELTDETVIVDGRTLYRIRALRDIVPYGVKAGDLGGFVESEANLSQDDVCWVPRDARVYGDAEVIGDTRIPEGAVLNRAPRIHGEASISNGASIRNGATICNGASISA